MQEILAAPLDATRVKQRSAGGSRPALSYLETHDVIRRANEVFGFGGWGHEVVELRQLEATPVAKDDKKGVCVGYICTVRLTVRDCIPTSGVGYGDATEYQATAKVTAHELAAKEAESDALKRALKNFGDQFGLALYDKQAATSGRVVQPPDPKISDEDAKTLDDLIVHLNDSEILSELDIRGGMESAYGTQVTAELTAVQAVDLAKRLGAKATSANQKSPVAA